MKDHINFFFLEFITTFRKSMAKVFLGPTSNVSHRSALKICTPVFQIQQTVGCSGRIPTIYCQGPPRYLTGSHWLRAPISSRSPDLFWSCPIGKRQPNGRLLSDLLQYTWVECWPVSIEPANATRLSTHLR